MLQRRFYREGSISGVISGGDRERLSGTVRIRVSLGVDIRVVAILGTCRWTARVGGGYVGERLSGGVIVCVPFGVGIRGVTVLGVNRWVVVCGSEAVLFGRV